MMGFNFKKSKGKNLKLNFSKSGIGISAGVKGLRISAGAKGVNFIAGKNGMYFRKKLNNSDDKSVKTENIESRFKMTEKEKINLVSKRTKNSFYAAIILTVVSVIFSETFLVVLFLPAILLMFLFVIFLCVDAFKCHCVDNKQDDDTSIFKSYFLENNTFQKRNKDGDVIRGKCEIEFVDDKFIIRQENEQIVNEISSVYYFGIWEYEDSTYFKIVMRSHCEYMFESQYFECEKIAKIFNEKGIRIQDDRE